MDSVTDPYVARLFNACQTKLFSNPAPQNELPLRNILLNSRLWSKIHQYQTVGVMTSSSETVSEAWLSSEQDGMDAIESHDHDVVEKASRQNERDEKDESSLEHIDLLCGVPPSPSQKSGSEPPGDVCEAAGHFDWGWLENDEAFNNLNHPPHPVTSDLTRKGGSSSSSSSSVSLLSHTPPTSSEPVLEKHHDLTSFLDLIHSESPQHPKPEQRMDRKRARPDGESISDNEECSTITTHKLKRHQPQPLHHTQDHEDRHSVSEEPSSSSSSSCPTLASDTLTSNSLIVMASNSTAQCSIPAGPATSSTASTTATTSPVLLSA
ncbi:uncharacterized protein BYT42DRAFT_548862 [Radiomyces spectabilis]|uniref:uncharacterized protein n=1 Tax=Radiomyces spectabilis TaxID=64574 RepID=UPI00222033BA|nr:uncharacterized protein BYT42DRAFT_548862 [Radiomyces spectabilis]KAI8370629.1 hypothetical protein BYT42DRAFT_548862 [Radiomyces spectabilis]